MTRKDYVLIAEVFSRFTEGEEIARALAGALASDNDRFDRTRFLKACGVNN